MGIGLHIQVPWGSLSNAAAHAVTKYVLLAIPLFIFAGNLMGEGGSARALIDMFSSYLRQFRGGLALVAVGACAFFGALSGSVLAAEVAIGTIMVPRMVEEGYNKALSAGLIAVSGILALIIPPSNNFIIYSAITGVPTGEVFIAGIGPGLLSALCIGAVAIFLCRKMKPQPSATWGERGRTSLKAIPALLMPLIVLGGIYGGIFTPTEAAAVATIYALFIGTVVYRELKWTQIKSALVKTTRTTGVIFIIIAAAEIFSLMMVYTRIPQTITQLAIDWGVTPVQFLLGTMFVLLILGTFLEAVPIQYIATPILFPIAQLLHLNVVQYGVVMGMMVGVGLITPPVGVGLYTTASAVQERADRVLKAAVPFLGALMLATLVTAFWEDLSMFLVQFMR
jgi:C4-dicarboxylate transporter DctM subunit